MAKIGNYLASNTQNSMMRLVLLIITIVGSAVILLVTTSSVIIQLKGKTVDWMGISTFIGAITLLMGSVITGKVTQKSKEKQSNDPIKTD